ncbi:Fic family protein [Clavibacter sp. VKM Ac-2872]|uniref:Fic/DOC family protein n=1 Tax=Clavibacter sp. VKM Ac-2872 TaxID=2783812 RepID=UPI001E4F8319|nr:Fic family protein [Clavibacter sp. VKM Ac-2872]
MTGTLRNHFGERDRDVLAGLEYAATIDRQTELMSGQVGIPRRFDADHVRAIHGYLFQDVYDWAGEYRTVPIYKGTPVEFADVASGAVDRYLSDVHRLVDATPWMDLDRDGFGERAATVFAYLNQAHPFREGNGRTSKVFMEHVAELSCFTLDYDRVDPGQWNEASKWSGPDLFAYEPHPAELIPVFRQIAVDRPVQRAPEASAAEGGRDRRAQRDLAALRAAQGKPSAPIVGPSRAGPGWYENPTAREPARGAGDRER